MIYSIILIFFSFLFSIDNDISVDEILKKIDYNLNSKSRILTSKMIVYGRRGTRTIVSKNWIVGINKAFTEYLSPPREAGVKMLKIEDRLFTYSPQTDRIIQISGHMLRQSVMGSDMSYNDIMEDKPLETLYSATLENEEIIDLFKKSLSVTIKSIGKSEDLEINFVDENPSIDGNQINLTAPSISSLKNNLNM